MSRGVGPAGLLQSDDSSASTEEIDARDGESGEAGGVVADLSLLVEAKKAFSIAEEVVVDDSGRSRDGEEDDGKCLSLNKPSLLPLFSA